MKKIILIGGGPIGLFAATELEKRQIDYLLLEGSSSFGGQISSLYPEKEIVDIPGIPSIKAQDYINKLLSTLNKNKLLLNQEVISIQEGTPNIIKTKNNSIDGCMSFSININKI